MTVLILLVMAGIAVGLTGAILAGVCDSISRWRSERETSRIARHKRRLNHYPKRAA